MIQLNDRQYLTLCEVEVYSSQLPATWTKGDELMNNIALRKSAWQTGIGWNGQPSRVVDGNKYNRYSGNTCSHTDLRDKPYWAVDLGASHTVTGVSITNRADCCSTRLRNYNVVVTNTRPAGATPAYGSANICAYRKNHHSGTLYLRCYKPISGRYVMIQLNDRQYLTLCEVEVYSSQLPATWT